MSLEFTLGINAIQPIRAHSNDVGWDIFTPISFAVFVRKQMVIDTGIYVRFPESCYGRLETRSSFALMGLIVAGGIIDPGYTGSLQVVLWNISDTVVEIDAGRAIAQLVISPYYVPQEESYLSRYGMPRMGNAFGSTDRQET